eukprot:SAG31_NODE_2721_length_5189_cov_4.868566_3_plen_102_part_00
MVGVWVGVGLAVRGLRSPEGGLHSVASRRAVCVHGFTARLKFFSGLFFKISKFSGCPRMSPFSPTYVGKYSDPRCVVRITSNYLAGILEHSSAEKVQKFYF